MIGSLDYRKKGHPAARYRSASNCSFDLGKTENMGWEVLPHAPYSPDLAPSDYHFFGFMKNQMRGQHYVTNEALQTAVCQCLWQLERSSTAREYSNFQNVGKIVCRETAIMSENKQMSMD